MRLLLTIYKFAMPLAHDRSKRVQLDAAVMEELTSLAVESDDFGAGCETMHGGSGARLEIVDKHVLWECGRAATWPNGPKTQRFLARLNETLPAEWHVY